MKHLVTSLMFMAFALCCSGCSIQGELVESRGFVDGWLSEGKHSYNSKVKLFFKAHNSYFLSLEKKLAGFSVGDQPVMEGRVKEKSKFLVEVRGASLSEVSYIYGRAILNLGGGSVNSSRVFYGESSLGRDCLVDAFEKESVDYFYEIKAVGDGDKHTCVIFEFDASVPSPRKRFEMLMKVKSSNGIDDLLVRFSPNVVDVYYR